MILKNPQIQKRLGGGLLERLGVRFYSAIELMLLRTHKDRATLKKIWKARWGRKTLVTFNESFLVHSLQPLQRARAGDEKRPRSQAASRPASARRPQPKTMRPGERRS